MLQGGVSQRITNMQLQEKFSQLFKIENNIYWNKHINDNINMRSSDEWELFAWALTVG